MEECLEALLAEPQILDIIIVDNGSDEDGRTILDRMKSRDGRVRILSPGRNLGFAAGCNLGGASARGHFLALVNPDLIVPQGTFRTILKALADHPGAWLCGARLLNMDGSEQRGGRRDIITPWRALAEVLRLDALFPNHPHFRRINRHETPQILGVAEVPVVSGAFMVFPMDRWISLNGLDEQMFLHMEDVDICLRTHLAGGQVLYCGHTHVHHHQGTSDAPTIWVEWHKVCSAIYYFRKHFRQAYPGWALRLCTLALWVRFAVLFAESVPQYLRWRYHRHRR